MMCIRCSREIDTDSTFCRFCGAKVRDPSTRPRRLTRLPDAGRLGGVCAGIASYLNTDVTFVRLGWVILSVWPGALILGAIAYVVAWIVVPVASGSDGRAATPTGERLFRSQEDRKIGGVCGGLAEYLGTDATLVRLAAAILAIVPGAIVMGVVAYLLAWYIVPARPAPALDPSTFTP